MLPLETTELIPTSIALGKSPTRLSDPAPKFPPSQQFRIEVWRESRKDKRQVRVIEFK